MATQVYDIVTAKAGPYIAGIKLNPGQQTITLTPEQAAYELAQGTILPTGVPGPSTPEPAPVLATDRVELKRNGLATRPTAGRCRRSGIRAPRCRAPRWRSCRCSGRCPAG